jgi:hypothetical protein
MVSAQALRNKITDDRRGSKSVAFRTQTTTSLAGQQGQQPIYRRVSNAFLQSAHVIGAQANITQAASISDGAVVPAADIEDDEDTEGNEDDAISDGASSAGRKPGVETTVKMDNGIEMTDAGNRKITRSKTAQSAAELRREQEEEDERKQKEYEAEMLKKPTPFGRLAKMNASEWKWLLLGTIGAILNGIIQPLFAVVFSRIANVFSPFNTNLRAEANFWSGMFGILGIAQFIAWVLQVRGRGTTRGELF